jgi:hypothetical protein
VNIERVGAINLEMGHVIKYKLNSFGKILLTLEISITDEGVQDLVPLVLDVHRDSTYYVMVSSQHGTYKSKVRPQSKVSGYSHARGYALDFFYFAEVHSRKAKGHCERHKRVKELVENKARPVNATANLHSEQEYRDSLKIRWGNAVVVTKSGEIATAFTLIRNADKISLRGVNGNFSTTWEAAVVATDTINNIAILKIKNKNKMVFPDVPFRFCNDSVTSKRKLIAMGYPEPSSHLLRMRFICGKSLEGNRDKVHYRTNALWSTSYISAPVYRNGQLCGLICSDTLVNGEVEINNVFALEHLLKELKVVPALPKGKPMEKRKTADQIRMLAPFVYTVEVRVK